MSDYNEIINRLIKPEIEDAVFRRPLANLRKLFPTEGTIGGDRITTKMEVARTSPAAAYTKADVNPSAATNTLVKPYWTKVQYHTTAEVSNIDISNAKSGGTEINLLTREIQKEADSLKDLIFTSIFTQIKSDVDSSAAYSDASLSRSTYAALASYEEDTDAAITLSYMRGMIQGTILNKNVGPLSNYICVMEQQVVDVFKPLAAALHTWNIANVNDNAVDMGFSKIGSFEGLTIADPSTLPGMTTGDVFMLRRQDVLFNDHRPFEIEQVASGRDTQKFVLRVGVNVHVSNPGFHGKMTSKD